MFYLVFDLFFCKTVQIKYVLKYIANIIIYDENMIDGRQWVKSPKRILVSLIIDSNK